MRKLAVIAIMLTIPATMSAQIPPIEREALLILYNTMDGPNWTNNSGWDTAVPHTECDWHGIVCEGGVVTEIDLKNGARHILFDVMMIKGGQ